ncbi:MAG: hypothetical protein QXX87_01670 [Candidatus Jordarchaeales archaeon]
MIIGFALVENVEVECSVGLHFVMECGGVLSFDRFSRRKVVFFERLYLKALDGKEAPGEGCYVAKHAVR